MLGWEVAYFNTGRLKKQEIYNPEHFTVEFDRSHTQLLDVEFSLAFGESTYDLQLQALDQEFKFFDFSSSRVVDTFDASVLSSTTKTFRYNEWVEAPGYKFKIQRGVGMDRFLTEQSTSTSSFEFVPQERVATWGMEHLVLETSDKPQSALLTLSLEGALPQKMADYLNASVQALQAYELREKNQMAVNTIAFIDAQISEIELALRSSESLLEQFRADNLIVNLGSEAEQILTYFLELEEEKAALTLKRAFYESVLTFLKQETTYSGLSLPNLASIQDPLVVQLAEQLIESSVNLERLNYALGENNPAVIQLKKEVEYTRQALYNVTRSAFESSDLVLNDVNNRLQAAQTKISKLPTTEQQLISIKREYELSGVSINCCSKSGLKPEF